MARNWRGVKPCKGPDHQDIPVGEVNEFQQTVDHTVTESDQSVDRPKRKAVDQLLEKLVHKAKSRQVAPGGSPLKRRRGQNLTAAWVPRTKTLPKVPFCWGFMMNSTNGFTEIHLVSMHW